MTLEDGTELSPALGIGAFAEKTLVAAGQCTKVARGRDRRRSGLLGCGVMAGLGAAINTGDVEPRQDRGGDRVRRCRRGRDRRVGAGRRPHDHRGRHRRRRSSRRRRIGATHTVDSSEDDPVAAIQELTDGQRRRRRDRGGRPAGDVEAGVLRPRPRRHRRAGRRADPGHEVPRHPADRLFGRGGRSSRLVRRLPAEPRLPDAGRPYQQGRLDLDAFVSEEIGLDDVEAAFERMHHGDVLRSVVIL